MKTTESQLRRTLRNRIAREDFFEADYASAHPATKSDIDAAVEVAIARWWDQADANGWQDLPYGGLVLVEDGLPVRVSDGATVETSDDDRVDAQDVLRGLRERWPGATLGEWQTAQGEPDGTAAVRVPEPTWTIVDEPFIVTHEMRTMKDKMKEAKI